MNTFIRSLAGVSVTILFASCGGGSDSSETIPDEDPPVAAGDPGVLAFSAPSYLVSESPGLRDEILVTRTGGTAGIVTAKISFSSGSATVDEDFEDKEILVRFGDGSSAPRLVRLPVVPDGDHEDDETLSAILHSPEGCVILGGQSSAEVTIHDDDDPAAGVISFTTGSYEVDESAGVATVTLQRTGSDFGVIAATMSTADGTAASSIDYGAVSATVAFQDGDSAQKTVQIPILDNTQPEADKTVLLSLVPSDGSVVGMPDAAVLTIRDNDQPQAGSLEFGASSYTVAEGAGSVTVEVTRTGGTSGAITVELTTADNSATAGDDYEAVQTTVSFTDGDSAVKRIDIVIIDDPEDEGDHIFDVVLSNPAGGAVLGSLAAVSVIITDDDGVPTLPPGAPTLAVSTAPKQLVFDWATVPDATFYRLMMDPTGTSGFSQVGADIALGETLYTLPIAAHLLDWDNARFLLRACNSGGCTDSNQVSVETLMLGAIGFFKASNTEGAQQRSPDGGDQFGWAVALSGDGQTLAVTAYDEDSSATFLNGDQSDNSEGDAGAVYVFSADQTGWIQQAYVKAPNTDNFDRFGSALALSSDGNTLAVGATGEGSNAVGVNGDQSNNDASNSGAVYIYTRSGTVWTLEAYLKASNTESQDRFGHAVALSDDGSTLTVGALGEASAADGIGADESNNDAAGAGAVYVFTRTGNTWAQQEYLKASNSETDDRFGNAVALSADGTMLAVAAPGEDSSATGINGDQSDNSASGSSSVGLSGAGAVYVFINTNGQWVQDAYVKASNTGADDVFGAAVTMSADGNVLAVGARREDSNGIGVNPPAENDNSAEDTGAAYVFMREIGVWVQTSYIKPSNTVRNEFFGTSMDLSAAGDLLVVGADGEDSLATGINGDQSQGANVEVGAAYLFRRIAGTADWVQQSYVKATNSDQGTSGFGRELSFGAALTLSADGAALAIGGYRDNSDATGINGDQVNQNATQSGAVYVY